MESGSELLQRLLSALAFYYNTRIESRSTRTGSGETALLHLYGTVEPNDVYGGHFVTAPARVRLDPDRTLRVALGLYREGLAAGSPFYRFLAFWNVLDARFEGSKSAVDDFLRATATRRNALPNASGVDVAEYLRDDSRNAIAHIVRHSPDARSIDPDMPSDRERLELDGLRHSRYRPPGNPRPVACRSEHRVGGRPHLEEPVEVDAIEIGPRLRLRAASPR